MAWTIDKEFSFCYGHRVWTQELINDYCQKQDTSCKCRHLHGHEGKVHVYLSAETLEAGMVTDFKHLGWLKDVLDDVLDHKFIIDRNDPLFNGMVVQPWKEAFGLDPESFSAPMLRRFQVKGEIPWSMNASHLFIPAEGLRDERFMNIPESVIEYLQSFVVVNFVPTSENLSKWLFDMVQQRMREIGVEVTKIEWNETPKSRSTYTA